MAEYVEKSVVINNQYRDSVSLMQISAKISSMEGIEQASIVVASEANLDLLKNSGLLRGETAAGPSDLLLALRGETEENLEAAVARISDLLFGDTDEVGDDDTGDDSVTTIAGAVALDAESNLALVSTPGAYAAAEARKALKSGMHVMLFSDNVSVEDEIELKSYASERELLVMGPDCGTAIINGTPLGFANVVSRGNIGIIAASGTGLQQVTSLIDRYGMGVSQAIGTGGHDLSERVGGRTMLQAFTAFQDDPETDVIVLISKPPSHAVAAEITAVAKASAKPVIINFLQSGGVNTHAGTVTHVRTLEDAARAAVAVANGNAYSGSPDDAEYELAVKEAIESRSPDASGSRYIRGLFSGGTFCYEALIIISASLGTVLSNTPLDESHRLLDVWQSQNHTVIDLGDDEFTRGRPHPMIDHGLRNDRIVKEAEDSETGVILLDVVLGYGSHMDPAAEMRDALMEARKVAEMRELTIIASVCGTAGDPQNLQRQESELRNLGVVLAESNAAAARLAVSAILGVNS